MPGISSGIRLRPASRGDIPAIVAISNSSIDEEENIGFGTPRSELVFSDVERLSAAWQDPNLVGQEAVWMAELDGRIVGCVTVEDRGEALELINIDVPRDLQGRGIGTRMVRLVEERARRERRRSVTLGTSRNAAGVAWKSLPWWQSRGYRITGEEENDWTRSIGAGVREIRMEKEIPQTTEILLRDVAERISRSSLSNNGTRRRISWRRSRPVIQTTRVPSPPTGTGFSTTTQSSQRRSCSKETWSGASRSSSTRNSASRRSPIGLERNIGEWASRPKRSQSS